nr:MAG: replication associated protein [Arizlama virus]
MAARKTYCFTYNNYTGPLEVALQNFLVANCDYAVYGREVAPTTGTPHLQGYIILKKKARITTLSNKLTKINIRLALLAAKGSKKQNTTYCKKDGDWWQHPQNDDGADYTEPKKENPLQALITDIPNKNLNALAIDNPIAFIRNHSGVKLLKYIAEEELRQKHRKMLVTVIYGTGGLGKSRWAREEAKKNIEDGRIYTLMNPQGHTVWWDGYDGQQALLMDDFNGYLLPHHLFRILDIYALQIPVKGGHSWANWNYVYITSNKPPSEWYSPAVMAKLDFNAYFRRFHRIGKMTEEEDNLVIRWEKFNDPVVPVDEPLKGVIQYDPTGARILEIEGTIFIISFLPSN